MPFMKMSGGMNARIGGSLLRSSSINCQRSSSINYQFSSIINYQYSSNNNQYKFSSNRRAQRLQQCIRIRMMKGVG
jgi:hypothetical protein